MSNVDDVQRIWWSAYRKYRGVFNLSISDSIMHKEICDEWIFSKQIWPLPIQKRFGKSEQFCMKIMTSEYFDPLMYENFESWMRYWA